MSKKLTIVQFVLIGIMAALIIVAAVLMISGNRSHEAELDSLDSQNALLESEGEQMELTIDGLQSAKAALEAQIAALKNQIADLESKLSDAEASYADGEASLRAEISAKNDEILLLEQAIAKYQTVFTIDVRAQAQLIDEIDTYISTMCPYVRMVDVYNEEDPDKTTYKLVAVAELMEEELAKAREAEDALLLSDEELEELQRRINEDKDEEAQTTLDEYNAMIEATMRTRVLARGDVYYPNVSVYYEDLATGYNFGYAEDTVYDSASVIKAPWILSLLQAVSADEKKFFDNLPKADTMPEKVDTNGDGVPDRVKVTYSDPKYDLNEKVIYNKATMYKDGSGKIKTMADGTEFTWLDFVKYTLEYSDNVAYQALRGRFGFTRMTSLASKVGARSVLQNGRNMTAADAGKLFKAIWEFVDTDERYGPIMKDSMRKSGHTVIIPAGVYPSAALHKYGWDTAAYHDAAVVQYGEKPYVLAIFSDLDNGGNEVNAYLSNIVKMVHQLHKGFYN